MPQAIVIGAGPAGSVASLLLSRRGWNVTLIEQHRFPRDKVCGECVSALGREVLARSVPTLRFRKAGAVELTRSIIHTESGAHVETPLQRPMWGLSRAKMDGILLDAAIEAGVQLMQPARAEAVTPLADRPAVRVRARNLATNLVEALFGDVVIIADGKAALGLKTSPEPTGDFGIKAHFKDVDGPRDAIELFATSGTYGGLAPIEGRRWNAAFSAPAEMLREFNGDLRSLFFDRFVRGNPSLARRLRNATSAGPWLAAPLPRFAVAKEWPDRVIPIGNAAAALEPIGGEGMGLAMRSAECAADFIAGAMGDWSARHAEELRDAFRGLWKVRRAACRAAAVVMSSDFADDVLPLAAASPALLSAMMCLMGK